MVNYKVGDIAALLGISKDTVRLYDDKDIITSKRKPNGYRYYNREDLICFAYVMTLKALDFPLDIIQQLLNDNDLENSLLKVSRQISLKRNELKKLESTIGIIIEYYNLLQTAQADRGRIVVKTRPEYLMYKLSEDNMGKDILEFENIFENNLSLITLKIPEELFIKENMRNFQSIKSQQINMISVEREEQMDLHNIMRNPKIIRLQPVKCLYTVVRTVLDQDYQEISDAFHFMEERGYTLAGSPILRGISFRNNTSSNTDYYQFWIPIK